MILPRSSRLTSGWGALGVLLAGLACAQAAEWSYSWKAAAGQGVPTAAFTPLQYGKKWAYSIELDDTPLFARTFAVDFFAKYQFTDAPPGVPGGKAMPVVGSVAVMVQKAGANATYLTWDQMKEMLALGWGMENHSFYHRGHTYGDTPEILTPEEMKEDLFWSQTLIAHEIGEGRAPTHFVYPNGYMPYQDYLEAVGIRSASRYGAAGARKFASKKLLLLDFPRNVLDEGPWNSPGNKGDPLLSLPIGGEPADDDLIIDFTHRMEADPASANNIRWTARLDYIAQHFGKDGSDTLWSAPVQSIVNYKLALQKATVTTTADGFTVELPDDLPGTALTVRLDNLLPETILDPIPGGVIHRQGTTAWVTTPVINLPGVAAPSPAVKRIFKGPVGDYAFDAPARLAAVILHQGGEPKAETACQVSYQTPDGQTQVLASKQLPPKSSWGMLIFSAVPNSEAPLATKVSVTPEGSLREMEVWVLE